MFPCPYSELKNRAQNVVYRYAEQLEVPETELEDLHRELHQYGEATKTACFLLLELSNQASADEEKAIETTCNLLTSQINILSEIAHEICKAKNKKPSFSLLDS